MKSLRLFPVIVALAVSSAANAITLVQTSDRGFYNNNIGTVLNDTDGGETGPFPVSDDANRSFGPPPTSAQPVLRLATGSRTRSISIPIGAS